MCAGPWNSQLEAGDWQEAVRLQVPDAEKITKHGFAYQTISFGSREEVLRKQRFQIVHADGSVSYLTVTTDWLLDGGHNTLPAAVGAKDERSTESSDLLTAADGMRAPVQEGAAAENGGMIYQDDNNYLDSKSSQNAPESSVPEGAKAGAAGAEPKEKKRRKNLTKNDVRKARDALVAANIRITPVSVYYQLQRGSFTTIGRYLHVLEQESIDAETKLKENDINRAEVERLAGQMVELAYLGNAEKLKTEINRAHTMMHELGKGCQQKIDALCVELDDFKDKLKEAEDDKQKLLTDKARLLKQNSEQCTELMKAEVARKLQEERLKQMDALYQQLLERLTEIENKTSQTMRGLFI